MHENKIQISAICAGFTTPHLVLLFLQTNIKHFSLCHKKMHLETKPESDMMTTICVDFKATDDAFYLVVKKWFQSQVFWWKRIFWGSKKYGSGIPMRLLRRYQAQGHLADEGRPLVEEGYSVANSSYFLVGCYLPIFSLFWIWWKMGKKSFVS